GYRQRISMDGPVRLFMGVPGRARRCIVVRACHARPSLILWDVDFRHTGGFVRVAIMMWFVLIALSPLLTYQHHVIDIVGGFVLAALCFGLFREPDFCSLPDRSETNNRNSPL